MSNPDDIVPPPVGAAFDAAALQRMISSQVSADVTLMLMTVSAFTPLIQSLMSFSASSSQRHHQAVAESGSAGGANLAITALAVMKLFDTPTRGVSVQRDTSVAVQTQPPYLAVS